MWILILVVLNTGMVDTVSFIKAYPNLKECEDTRIYITEEFKKVYPAEEKFYLECKEARKKQ